MLRPIIAVVLVATSSAMANQERAAAPTEGCLDARLMQEMRWSDARTLAILDQQGNRFRIDLTDDCSATDRSGASLLAKDGWVCGVGREYVRVQEQVCSLAGIRAIDAKEYARLARSGDSGGDDVTTLETVQVRSHRGRGFIGSHSYCFSPRFMRSWAEDGRGLLVEMPPQRAGGNRHYRVELAQSCPELFAAPAIRFESGVGVGVICGNPGDRVVVETENDRFRAGVASRVRCRVSAVYPVDESE